MSLYEYLKKKYEEDVAEMVFYFVMNGEFDHLTDEEFDYVAEFYGGKKALAKRFATQ